MSEKRKVSSRIFRAGTGLLKRLWVLLALLLAAQVGLLYVSVSEVRVPEFIVKHLLKKAEGEGFFCKIEDVRLRNLTVITAKGISVGSARGSDPFLRVRRCAVKLGPDALISGNPIPRFFYVDGAQFLCPSASSPTGKEDVLFSDGALILRRKDGKICVDSAEFCIGNAKFVVYGKIPEPEMLSELDAFWAKTESSERRDASPEKASVFISRFAGRLSQQLRDLNLRSLLNTGTFVVEIMPDGNALVADVSAFFETFNFREKFHFEKVESHPKLRLDWDDKKISFAEPICIFAENAGFEVGDSFTEEIAGRTKRFSVAARLEDLDFSDEKKNGFHLPNDVYVRADRLRLVSLKQGTLDLNGLLARISSENDFAFPGSFDFALNASLGKTTLACAGTLDAGTDEAVELAYDISVDPKLVWEFPQLRFIALREEIKALHFSEQPHLRGTLKLNSGADFEHANFDLLAGETVFENIRLCGLRIAGTLSPTEVRLPKVFAVGADFSAEADMFFEFADNGKFRVRTRGSVDPEFIDGRLGWFWERIWRDLKKAPSEKRPRADFDVYGRWGENWEYVFGAIAGEKCYGNGVLVDEISLRIYEDPLLISAFDMRFKRGDDFAFGNLQWHYAMEPDYHYRDFRFLFSGSIPPEDVFQIVGEGLPELLSEIRTDGAGSGVVSGFLSGDERYYPDRVAVEIKGEVPGKFSVFGIEGEDFKGEILYDNGVVFVGGPFFAEAGEGYVTGKIRVALPEETSGIEGTKVELDLDLEKVRRSRLFETFSALGNYVDVAGDAKAEKIAGTESAADRVPETPPAGEDFSTLDATFVGALTLPDIESLSAKGNFLLEDEDLFKLQIFGGFSRLLSSLKIDLTTFPMNRAQGSYSVRDGTVYLPDMRIFGESGEVDVQADLSLGDFSIDGEAVFRNLRGTQIPLIGKLVEWGSSPTQLLPVKLSGTLDNLEWKLAPKLHRIWSWAIPKAIYDPEGKDEDSDAGADE